MSFPTPPRTQSAPAPGPGFGSASASVPGQGGGPGFVPGAGQAGQSQPNLRTTPQMSGPRSPPSVPQAGAFFAGAFDFEIYGGEFIQAEGDVTSHITNDNSYKENFNNTYSGDNRGAEFRTNNFMGNYHDNRQYRRQSANSMRIIEGVTFYTRGGSRGGRGFSSGPGYNSHQRVRSGNGNGSGDNSEFIQGAPGSDSASASQRLEDGPPPMIAPGPNPARAQRRQTESRRLRQTSRNFPFDDEDDYYEEDYYEEDYGDYSRNRPAYSGYEDEDSYGGYGPGSRYGGGGYGGGHGGQGTRTRQGAFVENPDIEWFDPPPNRPNRHMRQRRPQPQQQYQDQEYQQGEEEDPQFYSNPNVNQNANANQNQNQSSSPPRPPPAGPSGFGSSPRSPGSNNPFRHATMPTSATGTFAGTPRSPMLPPSGGNGSRPGSSNGRGRGGGFGRGAFSRPPQELNEQGQGQEDDSMIVDEEGDSLGAGMPRMGMGSGQRVDPQRSNTIR